MYLHAKISRSNSASILNPPLPSPLAPGWYIASHITISWNQWFSPWPDYSMVESPVSDFMRISPRVGWIIHIIFIFRSDKLSSAVGPPGILIFKRKDISISPSNSVILNEICMIRWNIQEWDLRTEKYQIELVVSSSFRSVARKFSAQNVSNFISWSQDFQPGLPE